ncbi:M56 family metallopeptidase [Klenkia sp. PcliD-1-E]|uniref:M56 family metallopeptidase n=1 Tax=Klenkia sp. PcliD-1-E TaxID=2954492 RepID=UPI002097617B|nr:M56 family metallopeptidase [Klenkia sp. PcliD-1-E]MCO7220422.1 M56 family metallopeptidase [Klenkia sp. PcliD-1-E]
MVVLLAAGSAAAGIGQAPLHWLAARGADPTAVLTGWLLALMGLLVSAVSFLALLAMPTDAHPSTGLFGLAGGCWSALAAGSLPGVREALAGASTIAATVVLVRMGWAVQARVRARRATRGARTQLQLLTRGQPPGSPVVVRSDEPMAVAISGRPAVILISDSLQQRLSAAELAATVAHERAHVRGRHHLLIAIADTLAQALPRVPLLRAAPAAVRDLVELAADRAAARRCGAAAVHDALLQATAPTGKATARMSASLTAGGLAMTGGLTDWRLAQLRKPARPGADLVRVLACAAMAAAVLVLPVATGWVLVNTVACAAT